jgi:hypothetical protein
MAGQEMASIKELDYDFYQAHVQKFIIYFSPQDSWAPKHHYDDMKRRFPNGNYNSQDAIERICMVTAASPIL